MQVKCIVCGCVLSEIGLMVSLSYISREREKEGDNEKWQVTSSTCSGTSAEDRPRFCSHTLSDSIEDGEPEGEEGKREENEEGERDDEEETVGCSTWTAGRTGGPRPSE